MPPERAALVGGGGRWREGARGSVAGETVKLRGHVARPSVGPGGRKLAPAPGSAARGILTTRRIDAIRSQVLRASPPPGEEAYGCSSQTRCRSGLHTALTDWPHGAPKSRAGPGTKQAAPGPERSLVAGSLRSFPQDSCCAAESQLDINPKPYSLCIALWTLSPTLPGPAQQWLRSLVENGAIYASPVW